VLVDRPDGRGEILARPGRVECVTETFGLELFAGVAITRFIADVG
jgi:hypothetical protein